jgi:hypothetical protein
MEADGDENPTLRILLPRVRNTSTREIKLPWAEFAWAVELSIELGYSIDYLYRA